MSNAQQKTPVKNQHQHVEPNSTDFWRIDYFDGDPVGTLIHSTDFEMDADTIATELRSLDNRTKAVKLAYRLLALLYSKQREVDYLRKVIEKRDAAQS